MSWKLAQYFYCNLKFKHTFYFAIASFLHKTKESFWFYMKKNIEKPFTSFIFFNDSNTNNHPKQLLKVLYKTLSICQKCYKLKRFCHFDKILVFYRSQKAKKGFIQLRHIQGKKKQKILNLDFTAKWGHLFELFASISHISL